MKIRPDFEKASKVGLYVWQLGRNLLNAKRAKRRFPKDEFAWGVENEAHNKYYGAKEWFAKEIEKK